MIITYVGNRAFGNRIAEFSYNDKEEERFMKIAAYLENLGYNIDTGVSNWACIEVEDNEEYKQVLRDYKEAKKAVK